MNQPPLKILIESLLKTPMRADEFMIKWLRNVIIDSKRRARDPRGEYDHLLAVIYMILDKLIGNDIAPVVKNTYIFMFGENSPFFITWNDMITDNEKVVFEYICLNAAKLPRGSYASSVKLESLSVDFTHVTIRLLLLILAIVSNDGLLPDIFVKVYDVMLAALQRVELAHPLRKERFAPIGVFLRNLILHPLPKWDPYASLIPMI
jgi:hypothetical protein